MTEELKVSGVRIGKSHETSSYADVVTDLIVDRDGKAFYVDCSSVPFEERKDWALSPSHIYRKTILVSKGGDGTFSLISVMED